MAQRRIPVDPRQIAFTFSFTRQSTYRAAVLTVIESADTYLSAKDIAARAGISYAQTIFALFALHNAERILRQGRKSTARWGKLALAKPDPSGSSYQLLESLFHAIAKR